MTASEALELTNDRGYDYVMSLVVRRAETGYDWMYLDGYLYDRFGERLRLEGYKIEKYDYQYKLNWSNPSVFNQ